MNNQNILNMIPDDRYISRQQLVSLAQISDRAVRKAIEELRKEGYYITCSDTKVGYKMANNDQERKQLETVYKSRIRSELDTLVALTSEDDAYTWLMDITKHKYTG